MPIDHPPILVKYLYLTENEAFSNQKRPIRSVKDRTLEVQDTLQEDEGKAQ
jgi:hypothetical protein